MACLAPSKFVSCDDEVDNRHKHQTLAIQNLVERLQIVTKSPRENNGKATNIDYDCADTREKSSSSLAFYGVNSCRERRAAVLVCLFQGRDGKLRVILTKRSMNLSTHPGEVALPGGRMDEEDADDSATALREAKEEIGLHPSLVHIVANLNPFISLHLLTVVPVVGLLAKVEEFKPVLNSDEVDAIFDVPLEMFLEEGDIHTRVEKEWEGWKYVCDRFEHQTSEKERYVIGGLTASILMHVASLIYRRRTPPLIQHNLPNFTQLQFMLKANSDPLSTLSLIH
ncbi:PREDICTED: nudix hydrolase 15, mitochondrial-like [Ipomoea nil]|uniref:nudix hydrolase 15, mitochondrial-like n=1 Tax=Ipomoea nil TaxID=35883 RepID=UPI000900D2F0|nr:PREDICTED: nudix hydrolase 15, mitochondrial-like [Ipomoea nil]